MLRFRHFFALFLLLPGLAFGQSKQVVVVELFTSQGCSSCPPADVYLAEMLNRDDVLPLAFHVDYWDRLGWPDTFGDAAHTKRQYAYAHSFHNRSVWTPQFVVQGSDYSKGNFRKMVDEYVGNHKSAGSNASVAAVIKGENLIVEASGRGSSSDILIVHFTPKESVKIKRGENAGRNLTYHNIVHAAYVGGKWNGRGDKRLTIPLKAKPPLAVIVQEKGTGPILAATAIR